MANLFKNKSILVTGGTGFIGSEIVRRLLRYNPRVVRVFSNDESKQFELQLELGNYENLRFLIGDIKDRERLNMAMEDIQIVFHTAALKHVPFCEYNPFEAVKTNVYGTQNVIETALKNGVEKVIFISTDKATQPFSTLGASKLLAERLIGAANFYKGKKITIFSTVRFGNIIGSSGSIFEVIEKQISTGGPVTVTNKEMTRFVMTKERACELLFRTVGIAKGGEIFIFKMDSIKIGVLVEVLVKKLAPRYGYTPERILVKETGERPGEKMHELLMTEEEASYALEKEDMFIIQSPIIAYNVKAKRSARKRYSSLDTKLLSKAEVRKICENARI